MEDAKEFKIPNRQKALRLMLVGYLSAGAYDNFVSKPEEIYIEQKVDNPLDTDTIAVEK